MLLFHAPLAGAATIGALRTAARVAAGLGIAAAGMTGAGAAGVLPTPVQNTVAHVVAAVLPLDLPHTDRAVVADPASSRAHRAQAQATADSTMAGLVADLPDGSVSVMAVDMTTGAQYAYGARSGMKAGSAAKLLILEGYLLHDQDAGREPGGGQGSTLATMIRNSDNDAADSLYRALGYTTGAAEMMWRLGLTATFLGPAEQWGLSTTSAADQLVLLHHLVAAGSPLSDASKSYALDLMSDVETDQQWGVGAATDPGTSVANKNGWLSVDDDHQRWLANSLGVITVNGHQVLMAVLTQHNDDFAGGVQLVEAVARTAASALS
jgi:beta-lactamase class A